MCAIDNYWVKYGRAQTGIRKDERQSMAKELAVIVDELLKTGADVNKRNSHGDSALTLAKRNRFAEIAELLKEAGAEE
jgi:ankyrin repeat protein